MNRSRRLSFLVSFLLLACVWAGPAPATLAAPQASLPDIEDEVMCPICGTLLELSDSPQADRERRLIRGLIAQGLTKDQVKDRLVEEYGESVLAEPGGSGADLIAWIVPGLAIALVVALGGGLLVRRRRQEQDAGLDRPLNPAEAARLDDDISRYRL